MAGGQGLPQHAVEIVARGHGHHVDTGHHDLADDLVSEIHYALHQLPLLQEAVLFAPLGALFQPHEVGGREDPLPRLPVVPGRRAEYRPRRQVEDHSEQEQGDAERAPYQIGPRVA